MSIFDKLDGVLPNEGRNQKLPEGDFTLEVVECIEKVSQQTGDNLFIVEFKVTESSVDSVKVGEGRSWVQYCKDPKVYLPALSGFICSTLGYDGKEDHALIEKEIAPKLKQFGAAFTSQGIAKGFLVKCNVKDVTTKGGRPFKLHTFRRALKPKEQMEQARAKRAA